MARPTISAPSKLNTIEENEQVSYHPLYARPKALSEVMGISFSKVRRVLIEYEEDVNTSIEDLYIYVTETLRVVDIKQFVEYLKERQQGRL